MLATASTHSIDSVADPLRTQPACDTSAAAEQPLNLAAEISLYMYIHTLTTAPFMTLGVLSACRRVRCMTDMSVGTCSFFTAVEAESESLPPPPLSQAKSLLRDLACDIMR
jgi:hypothetical protein